MQKRLGIRLLGLLLTALFVRTAFATNLGKAPNRSDVAMTGATGGRPLNAPLFLDGEDGFISFVTVVNATFVQQSFDFILTDRAGRETLRTVMNIAPHSQRRIGITDELRTASLEETSGSVQLVPHVKVPQDMPLAAQLSIEQTLWDGSVRRVEEEFEAADMHASAEYRAAATSIVGFPTIALRSLSDQSQQVKIACIKESGETTWSQLVVPAATLITTRICRAESRAGADEQAARDRRTVAQTIGVTVSTSKPGGLQLYGFAAARVHEQEDLTPLYFENTAASSSSSFVFPGIPIGPTSLFPGSNYKPHLGMVNFGSTPVHASIIYSSTQSGTTAPSGPIAKIVVPPWSALTAKLPELVGNPDLQNSFLVESDAPRGTLSATLRATSEGVPSMDLVPHEKLLPANGGLHPWQIGKGASSLLLLFNTAGETHKFTVNLYASGKKWVQFYSLAAYETAAVDIGNIVSEQVADESGRQLPVNTTEGEVNWFDLTANPGEGRLLQAKAGIGLARSFSCFTVYAVCAGSFQTSPMTIPIGTSKDNTL